MLFSLLLPVTLHRNVQANLVQLTPTHSLGLAEELNLKLEVRSEDAWICSRIIAWPGHGHVHGEVRSLLDKQGLRRGHRIYQSSTVVCIWNLSR